MLYLYHKSLVGTFMKNTLKSFLSIFILLIISSCSLNNKIKNSSITIALPGSFSREAETNSILNYVLEIKSNFDDNSYVSEGTSGDILTIEIPAGIYNILLKAYEQNDTNKETVIYKAEKNDVEVIEDNETKITLTLLKQIFTITVLDEDGNIITSFNISRDNVIDSQLKEFTEKEDYVFDGWYYGDELFDFDTKISKDLQLVGKWKKSEAENEATEETEVNDTKESEVIKITEGITIQVLSSGFEIKVTKTSNSKDWTWAKVEEASTKTTYDLYPALNKLNNKETITFIFPYVNKNAEYEFIFSNPDIENGQVSHKIKAAGGSGELDYSIYNKLETELSFDGNGSCVVSVGNLNKEVTSFLNDSKATFFFRIYGSTDEFSTQTNFICEKTDTIDGDDDSHFYYDLLNSGYVNFADAESYYWNDSSTLGDTLNQYSQYFVQIGYYFNSTDNGRFQTKLIESKAFDKNKQ